MEKYCKWEGNLLEMVKNDEKYEMDKDSYISKIKGFSLLFKPFTC